MRRFRDLIALHTNDLGGENAISEAERALIRRAVTLIIALEQLEYRFAQNDGEAAPSALDQYQCLSNTLRRLLQTLGVKRRARDATSLREYLDGKAMEAAE